MKKKFAILRGKKNNSVYSYLSETEKGHELKNLTTGVVGVMTEEQLKNSLNISLPLTELIGEFPLVGTMIEKLNLKIEIKNA